MSEGIRPFHNGSEDAIWTGRNCDHCAKYNPDLPLDEGQCEIDKALVSLKELKEKTRTRRKRQ